jgi:hypothetical protein
VRGLELAGHVQPILRVPQIAERDEGCAAIRRVRRAFFHWRASHSWFAALEDFIGFDVTTLAVQVGAALNEVTRSAAAEHAAQRDTCGEYGVSTHLIRIRAPLTQS